MMVAVLRSSHESGALARFDAIQDRGAFDCIVLQLVQCLVGLEQGKPLHLSADRNFRSDAQKIFSILAGVFGYAANHASTVEQISLE